MNFEEYAYTIAPHWVCPIEYDDRTGLEDDECRALDAFLDSLPGSGHWSWGEDELLAQDEISGLYAGCITGLYMVPAGGAA